MTILNQPMQENKSWFRCIDRQPDNPNWYAVKYSGCGRGGIKRFWWDGDFWRRYPGSQILIFGSRPNTSRGRNDAWRSIAEDTNASSLD